MAKITQPKWKSITASQLMEWKNYLYSNWYYKIRIIKDIIWDHVYYYEVCEYMSIMHNGYCTKTHFARMCKNEATKEEYDIISKQFRTKNG